MMTQLTLRPWRLLLAEHNNIPADLDEALYASLVAFENKLASDGVDWDSVAWWNIDQDLATLTLTFDDESNELKARIQILGSFDGSTFMWACHNPSIDNALKTDSKRLRDFGRRRGWEFFAQDQFSATSRDGYAMMTLATQTLQSPSAYAGRSGDQVIYFLLYDLVHTDASGIEVVQKQPESSIFDTLDSMISRQVEEVQIGLPELRVVEAQCADANSQIQAGDYQGAMKTLEAAWKSLGIHAVDQEPASWIRLAKGNALYLAGDLRSAYRALVEAEDSYACPDKVLLYTRMGQCAAGLDDATKAADYFIRVYVAAGAEGLANLSEEHRTLAEDQLATFWQKAKQRTAVSSKATKKDAGLEQAQAIVRCLIEDLCQFEKDANKLSSSRDDEINSRWCKLLATWCTSGHKPRCGGYSNPPEHNPKQEKITDARREVDGTISIETVATKPLTRHWRYTLCEEDGELRVSQIYSVFDYEEIAGI